MIVALGGLTLGCGDDSTSASGSAGSSGTTGGSTGDVATTMTPPPSNVDSSESGVVSGAAESGSSSGGSSSSGAPPVEVTLEGEVLDLLLDNPIPNTEISAYDDPTITATADANGLFSIGTFQPNTGALLVLAPSDDYWGAVVPVDVGADPLQEDVELTQISTSIVNTQFMQLEAQNPAPLEENQSIVIVRLLNNTATMEGPTTVTMDPPPLDDTFYAPNDAGAPVLNSSDIEFALIPVAVFYNLGETQPGEITISATHPTRECTVLYPDLPTIFDHMTLFDIECLPA